MVKHPATQPRYAMMKAGYPKMKAVLTAATMSNPTSYHVSVIQEIKISTNNHRNVHSGTCINKIDRTAPPSKWSSSSNITEIKEAAMIDWFRPHHRSITVTQYFGDVYLNAWKMQCWCVSKNLWGGGPVAWGSSVDTGSVWTKPWWGVFQVQLLHHFGVSLEVWREV